MLSGCIRPATCGSASAIPGLHRQPSRDRVDARSNLGAVLVKLGRYQDAIEQYQEALKIAPPDVAPAPAVQPRAGLL